MNVAQNFNPLHVKIHAGDDCNLFGCHEQKYPTQNFFQLLPRFLLTCAKNPVYYYCCAGVAQLVEQLIRNQQVAGSSPATSSKKGTVSYDTVPFLCFPDYLRRSGKLTVTFYSSRPL